MDKLIPPKFTGHSSENAERWLRDFEAWAALKELEGDSKIGCLPLLLTDSSRIWFDNLSSGDKNSYDNFKTLFEERFKRNESFAWKDKSDVWHNNQRADQTAEAFITDMEEKGLKAKIKAEDLKHAIMRGLKPHLRQALLAAKSTNTLEEIRQFVVAIEAAEDTNASTLEALSRALARLEAKLDSLHSNESQTTRALDRLETQIHDFQINMIQSATNTWSEREPRQWQGQWHNHQNGKSYPYSDNQTYAQYNNGNTCEVQNTPTHGHIYTITEGRAKQYRNAPPPHTRWRGQGPGQINIIRENTIQCSTPELCTRCGKHKHKFMSQCPAKGAKCRQCGYRNHYAIVCRTKEQNRSWNRQSSDCSDTGSDTEHSNDNWIGHIAEKNQSVQHHNNQYDNKSYGDCSDEIDDFEEQGDYDYVTPDQTEIKVDRSKTDHKSDNELLFITPEERTIITEQTELKEFEALCSIKKSKVNSDAVQITEIHSDTCVPQNVIENNTNSDAVEMRESQSDDFVMQTSTECEANSEDVEAQKSQSDCIVMQNTTESKIQDDTDEMRESRNSKRRKTKHERRLERKATREMVESKENQQDEYAGYTPNEVMWMKYYAEPEPPKTRTHGQKLEEIKSVLKDDVKSTKTPACHVSNDKAARLTKLLKILKTLLRTY